MSRMFVLTLAAAIGCGPTPADGADSGGDGGGGWQTCRDGAVMLHQGAAGENVGATPWFGGHFLIAGGAFEHHRLLDVCLEKTRQFREDTRVYPVAGSQGQGIACDLATEEVYRSGPLGEPLGSPIAVARSCYVYWVSNDANVTGLSLSVDDQIQLISDEGETRVVDLEVARAAAGLPEPSSLPFGSSTPRIAAFESSATQHFVVLDDRATLHAIEPVSGDTWPIASGVSEQLVRGSRVFFKSADSGEVRVYDAQTEATTLLPTTALGVECAVGVDAQWYLVAPEDQAYCDRAEERTIVDIDTGETFDLPDGLYPGYFQPLTDSIVLAGESISLWDPTRGDLQQLWADPSESAVQVPTAWGLDRTALVVVEERSGAPHLVILPLDGTEPYDLLGDHPAQWAYAGDEDGVIAVSLDSELVHYDYATKTLEALATDVVGASYHEVADWDHPPHLLFDRVVGSGGSESREVWLLPLPVE